MRPTWIIRHFHNNLHLDFIFKLFKHIEDFFNIKSYFIIGGNIPWSFPLCPSPKGSLWINCHALCEHKPIQLDVDPMWHCSPPPCMEFSNLDFNSVFIAFMPSSNCACASYSILTSILKKPHGDTTDNRSTLSLNRNHRWSNLMSIIFHVQIFVSKQHPFQAMHAPTVLLHACIPAYFKL